jgi:hypothetical protein
MYLNILIIILAWIGISIALFIITFLFYLAVINLRDAHQAGMMKQVHFSVYWAGYSILIVGLIFDTMLNWVFLTITFLELPREFLATNRVVRHKYNSRGWRHSQAKWWCKNWLAPFDSGHCDRITMHKNYFRKPRKPRS